MKTKASLITIFMISFFLVSLTAISISLAESRQNERLPDSQQPPPRTSVPRAEAPTRADVPKDEFWDLVVDYCTINGEFVEISPGDLTPDTSVSVNVGQTVNFKCYYKIITIPVAFITKMDAAVWGSGSITYKNWCAIGILNEPKNKEEMKSLPHFTWADVTKWQALIKPGMADVTKWQTSKYRKVWKDNMMFTWTPTQQDIGIKGFYFNVDSGNLIKEPVQSPQNNWCIIVIEVNP